MNWRWLLVNYGHHIAPLLMVTFLGLLSFKETTWGRLLMVITGIAFGLTVWFGITLSL